ncbi:hypothetical protein, partial [Citrobacter sp. FDAARGOS_156]|uniref:hypothetical protein n=1 Tax=Citrobacter sp. FDAARGOS_156 TaxID=1702170 RepID=UPI0034D76583
DVNDAAHSAAEKSRLRFNGGVHELEKVKKDVVRMRIYTTHRRIAKRLSTNDSGKNVTMSKRRSFLDCGCSLL